MSTRTAFVALSTLAVATVAVGCGADDAVDDLGVAQQALFSGAAFYDTGPNVLSLRSPCIVARSSTVRHP
jgi:hypothetical protein